MTNEPRRVRLCMIGAGKHASLNIYPYFHFLAGEAEVPANCDLDVRRAQEVGRRFGIDRAYADYREMLDREEPDGVMVCVDDRTHARLAMDIMNRGFHVYTEKPHAPDLALSREMLETAVRTRRICMTAFKKRFGTAYRRAREIIRGEAFGRPTLLTIYRGKGGHGEQDDRWLWQWGCHVTDLATYLFGPVAEVQAVRNAHDWSAVCVNLRFAGGAAGQLAYCSPGGSWERVLAVGEGMGALTVENSIHLTSYCGNTPVGGHCPSFVAGAAQGGVEMGFVGELKEFVAAIRELRQPEANIAYSTHTAALHEAVLRSVSSGRSQAVEAFDPARLPPPQGRSAG